MDHVVLSIGGSVILAKESTESFLDHLAKLLLKLSKTYRIFIVVGGGHVARTYINQGRALGLKEETLDEFGIAITRVNAKLLSHLLKTANTAIPETTDDAKKMDKSIIIMGGTTPGHSTDMVAAELAEKVKAKQLVIATNVNGIYDKDPNQDQDAQQLKDVSIDVLIHQYGTAWDAAGKNVVVDGPALRIIKQAKIPTVVVNGQRLDQLEKAITNQSFDGTTITL